MPENGVMTDSQGGFQRGLDNFMEGRLVNGYLAMRVVWTFVSRITVSEYWCSCSRLPPLTPAIWVAREYLGGLLVSAGCWTRGRTISRLGQPGIGNAYQGKQ